MNKQVNFTTVMDYRQTFTVDLDFEEVKKELMENNGFDDVVEEIREYADCDFKKDRREDYLDSLSEGKDLDDYGSKVDALVDSMGVTDKKESTIHRRKDLDML